MFLGTLLQKQGRNPLLLVMFTAYFGHYVCCSSLTNGHINKVKNLPKRTVATIILAGHTVIVIVQPIQISVVSPQGLSHYHRKPVHLFQAAMTITHWVCLNRHNTVTPVQAELQTM